MDSELNYIRSIEYVLSNLQSNIKQVHIKSRIVMSVYRDMINYNCDMLQLYARELRDKLENG
jgi:hypothetical protein